MKKRTLSLLLAAAAALALTACGDDFAVVTVVTVPSSEAQAEPAEGPVVEVLPSLSAPEDESRYAFGDLLWGAYQQGILPDGTLLDWNSAEGAAENSFALCDVDGDGAEELLLYWTNASMAGNRLDVFGCRNGELFTELTAFPAVTFYDSGAAQADWSHNQGLAGNTDFWPYDLYAYHAETDTYVLTGAADAWSQESGTGDQVSPFPVELDADGDGMLYFLLPADWNGCYDINALVDGPEYSAWRARCLDGGSPLTIPTQPMTEENIAALGAPKPDISVPEAAG